MRKILALIIVIVVALVAAPTIYSKKKKNMTTAPQAKDVKVEIKTTMGDITVLLYGDTPRHTENFVKHVNEGYYDGVLFHRVINDFMVQTGDPDSKNPEKGRTYGAGGPDYEIEAEFVYPKYFHKYGALAAARTGDQVNPEKKSSGSQFYIVTGKKYSTEQIDQMERNLQESNKVNIFNKLSLEYRDSIKSMMASRNREGLENLRQELIRQTEEMAAENPFKFTPEQREAYTTVGGTPHLDNAYTVFGEVIKGMDVVEAIQKVETDANDRPKEDVKIISMKVLKK